MSIEKVRSFFRLQGMEDHILEFAESSATVELAAHAVGCEPARIAKTLSFLVSGNPVLVVTAGDMRIAGPKFKAAFHEKPRMISASEVEDCIGHAVGGVCPFAVKDGVKVHLDVSMRRFATVFPACGSDHSAIELTLEELEKYSRAAGWVDVCKCNSSFQQKEGNMRMRLFIAIQFEENILQALTRLQSEWKALGMQGHAASPQNLHLTLAFIGEYGSPDAVLDAMADVPLSRFSIHLNGIGNFGDLYWAGIAKNNTLSSYVQRLRRVLAEHGIPYDRKRFSPHITLVRRAVFHGSMEELLCQPPSGSMEVSSVALMSSTRGKNDMIYTKVGGIEAG